jgi:gamma-glutamyl-gamma-aminobutyraldehyde dehydrogenase
VVGAVVPWHFPLTLASWKAAPALAAGCTVVLTPSENSPLSALLLGRIAIEAGLPPGVLNVVNGDGPTAGRALGLHADVDVLAFTGSVWLELGGKSPNIVLPDAPDLEKAAATAAWAIFFNQGEMCTAPSRLLVYRSIADRVTECVVRRARQLWLGDPSTRPPRWAHWPARTTSHAFGTTSTPGAATWSRRLRPLGPRHEAGP